jgi:hypothetical protein
VLIIAGGIVLGWLGIVAIRAVVGRHDNETGEELLARAKRYAEKTRRNND